MGEMVTEYEDLGGGTFLKWETIGQSVRGTFIGLEPGKFGQNVKLATEDGVVIFGRTRSMVAVDALHPGDDVSFEFTGTRPSKYAQPTKLFRIGRRKPQDEVPF